MLRTYVWLALAPLFFVLPAFAQEYAPVPAVQPPKLPTKVLDAIPAEIKHEGTRLYELNFVPKVGELLPAGGVLTLKFKYETDKPGKIFVGAMPYDAKKVARGGYQPASLAEAKGTAETRIFVGAEPHSGKITTGEELRASYQQVTLMEVMIYGAVTAQQDFHMPIEYAVIPHATFSVKEQFYLDRLIEEVTSLRKRVHELESKVQ